MHHALRCGGSQDVPGKPADNDYVLIPINYGRLHGTVACLFGLLGFFQVSVLFGSMSQLACLGSGVRSKRP